MIQTVRGVGYRIASLDEARVAAADRDLVGGDRAAERMGMGEQVVAVDGVWASVLGMCIGDEWAGDPEAAAQDYRRLILHWRRAGLWATQWTMLRASAGLLARLGRPRDAAVLDRVRDVLRAMGSELFHVGPLGAGHAVKAGIESVAAPARRAAWWSRWR